MTEIAAIYKDYLKMLEEKPGDFKNVEYINNFNYCGYVDEQMNPFNPTMRLFQLILKKRGFLGNPSVVENSEYDSINLPAVYHGFKKKQHAKAYLFGENFHMGSGDMLGTYYTQNKTEAQGYTKIQEGISNNVLEAKVCSLNGESFASIIELLEDLKNGKKENFCMISKYNQLLKEFVEFMDSGDNEKWKFCHYITKIPQIMAAYLDIDYLTMEKLGEKHLCVLNRSSVVTSKQNSKVFDNCVAEERI